MKSGKNNEAKLSKQNKLLINILIISIVVVFCLLAVLVYINYYTRIRLVLTTVSRYQSGDIKNVTEYEVIDVKKGRNISNLPQPNMEGYIFGGWYKDINYTQPFDYNEQLMNHMQVYGKFTLIEYSIDLVLDGEKKVTINESKDIDYTKPYTIEDLIYFPKTNDIIKLDDGTETTIADYKAQYKYGYTFEGWGLSATASTTYPDEYLMRAQNLTFYAVWKPIQVELRYKSQNLDFTGSKISSIRDRIDNVTNGLTYQGVYTNYETIVTQFNSKVEAIIAPVDKFSNFDFAGWYLDPEFLFPLNITQLYVKSGYFTMTQTRDVNILYDDLYYKSASINPNAMSIEHLQTISSYSSTTERNCYITLFAKWELKEYKINFNLNVPYAGNEFQNYIVTDKMRSVVAASTPETITNDKGEYVRPTYASQGWKLYSDDGFAPVIYYKDYFKDAVYRVGDQTGLPMYTLLSWNTKRDGSGFSIDYTNQIYFDKDDFKDSLNTFDNEITLYAQWQSYYRVNYYYKGVSTMQKSILLSTVNVDKNTIELPDFYDLVSSVNEKGVITFTQKQIDINKITTTFATPLNYTFVGWRANEDSFDRFTKLYLTDFTYDIGTQTADAEGIRLNNAQKNLYTTWMSNNNYYTYNLGTTGEINYQSEDIKDKFINESGSIIYPATNSSQVFKTISGETYQITKVDGGVNWVLSGWKLKDGTLISGVDGELIRFNFDKPYFVYNSETYKKIVSNVRTNIYLLGNVPIDNENYCTQYSEIEDKSYVYLKFYAKILIFEADWNENVVLKFYVRGNDIIWENPSYKPTPEADGTYRDDVDYCIEKLTTLGAGTLYMTMQNLPNTIAKRPYYEFVGWSTVNREAEGISYSDFASNYAKKIFTPNQKYSAFQFSKDTKLYAIWKPIVFSVELNQLSQSSSVNYSAGTVYLSREKFTDGSKKVTDKLILNGNLAWFELDDGTTKNLLLSTSTVVGKGFAGWLKSNGNELVKGETGYEIALISDESNKYNSSMFKQFPSVSSDYFIKLYPKFDDLKFNITFKLSGIGIENGKSNVIVSDVKYGTSVRSLISSISMPSYQNGYEYSGWMVSGDKNNDGTLKDDYLIDLQTSNLSVKSDLVLTLIAKKQSFSVRFIYNNPSSGVTEEIQDFTLDYNSTVEEIYSQVEEKLNGKNYVGYNFKYWQVAGGGSSTPYNNIKPITIVSPLNIYPIFVPAEVTVVYRYYSEDSSNSDNMETVEIVSTIGNTHMINSSGFAIEPKKNDGILSGWTFDNIVRLKDGDKLTLDFTQLGEYLEEYKIEGDDAKHYRVVLNAVWSEAVKLSIDLEGAIQNGVTIPSEIVVAKDTKLYFKDIANLSSLTNGQLYKNDYTMFTGKWIDESGVVYNAYLNTSFIDMKTNKTIKPVFESVVFTIEYWYKYSDNYYMLDGAKQSFELNYSEVPKLLTLDELTNYIWKDYRIADYTCIALYLGSVAFENTDTAYKFYAGDEFDFAKNQPYLDRSENYVFKFYMDLKKLTTITYYMDRSNTDSSTDVRIAEGSHYVIGTSKLGLTTPDIIPTKKGYVFKGWSKSTASTVVSYANGNVVEYSAVMFSKLYPVWETAKVTVNYYETNGKLTYNNAYDCYSEIFLYGDTIVGGTKLKGWQIDGKGKIYAPGSSYVLSDSDVNFYAVREKYYTIYYYNGISSEGVTFNERIIIDETFTPKEFGSTGLTAKLGADFNGWSISENTAALVESFVINSRSGNTLNLNVGSIQLENDNDYTIKLYATWNDNKFYAKFDTFDASGNLISYYGKTSPLSCVTEKQEYGYDETTYTFIFPTTIAEYSLNGETFRFDGVWTDETGKRYSSSSVNISFVKNYEFTPVYKKVIALKFITGGKTIYSQDVVGVGSSYNLNNSELLKAINEYNKTLNNQAVIGWELEGVYYSHLTAGDNGYNYQNWNSSLLVNGSAELEAVVVDLIDVKIYRNIVYNASDNTCTFDESSSEVLTGHVVNDTISLAGYVLSGKYSTIGWVITTNNAYKYNKNASGYKTAFTITSTLASSNTIYAYPMLKIQISYAVDSVENVKQTSFIVLGESAPKVEDIFVGDNYYLGDWHTENGDPYEFTPLYIPTTLVAQAMPYYTIEISDAENRIDKSLVFTKLTPDTIVTLPVENDVEYNSAYDGGLKLLGWYIKDITTNNFVMNGSDRKKYALGEKVDIRSFGITSDDRTYGLVPIFDYTLEKFTLAHMYNAVKYGITYSSNDGNEYYTTNANGDYEFYVLKNYPVIVENTKLTLVAYLFKNGKTVIENYDAVKKIVYVNVSIREGYSFSITDGWFECSYDERTGKYTKGSALPSTLRVLNNTMVTINEPTAESISVSFGLADENYNKLYNTSKAYFLSGETKVAELTRTGKSGSLITQVLYLVNGYELITNSDGDVVVLNEKMDDLTGTLDILFSIKDNVVTISYVANYSGYVYLAVRPCNEVKLKLSLDSSRVAGYDASKILDGSNIRVSYNENHAWKFVEEVPFASLISGEFTLNTKIPANSKIQVVVNLKSYHYYVNSMILSGTGGLDQTINSYLLEDYEVALAPMITIVLDNRTYSLDVYFNNEFKESTTPVIVQNANGIALNNYTLSDTMKFGGYKFSALNDGGVWTLCKFVSGVTANLTASELIKRVQNVAVANKNETIKVEGICYAKSVTLVINGESGKSVVNGNLQQSIAVPIGSTVVVGDNKLTMPVGTYSVNSNGELVGVTVTTITLTMLGSYQFDKWVENSNDFTGVTITADMDGMEITGLSKAGSNKISAVVKDLSDTTNCSLVGLSVADLEVITSSTNSTTAYYDDSLKQNGLIGNFTTATIVKVGYKLYSGFTFDSFEITYNSLSSKNYSSLDDFATACGITLSVNGTTLVIENAIFDIEVVVNLKRMEYAINLQVAETSQSTTSLDTLYQNLKANGTTFAMYNGTNAIIFAMQNYTNAVFRKKIDIKITANSDYFVLDKIYINSTSQTVYPSEKVDFASFDAQNNILSIYSGGNGKDITIFVAVKFKEFKAVFHKPDNSEFASTELSGGDVTANTAFAFDTVKTFNKNNFAIVKNGIVSVNRDYSFVGWKYYNGNYELDSKNGTVDMTKLADINSFEYDFATNNNLHLFGEWEDLYSISFNPNGEDVGGLPSTIIDKKLGDMVSLSSIPSRSGFDFAGWFYVYDGTKYYLNYNGVGFDRLVNASGDLVASDTSEISSTDITLKQLLTDAQISATSIISFEITLQANWKANGLNVTLSYDPTMCDVEQQIYNGSDYVSGTLSFGYQDTLEHSVTTLDKEYHIIIVKGYAGEIKGRIICKPLDSYEFKEFAVNSIVLKQDSKNTLTADSTISVVCWGEYISHNITFNWDKLFSDAVNGTHYGSLGGYGSVSATKSTTAKYNFSLNVSFYDTTTKVNTAGVAKLKLVTSGGIELLNTVSAGLYYINDNFDISNIMVELRKGYEAKFTLNMLDTPYVVDTSKTTFVTLDSSNYVFTIASDVPVENSIDFKLNTKNVNLKSSFVDSLVSSFGKCEVMYYVPNVNDAGMIDGYTLKSENVNATTSDSSIFTVSVVADSVITINYNSDDFVLNNIYGSTNSTLTNNSWKIETLMDSTTETYTLGFDYNYVRFNFNINENVYASAYFKTQNVDASANQKLQAFYKLITYGVLDISSSTRAVLTSTSDDNEYTNIIKSIAPLVYYTNIELFGANGYEYAVNENLVKNRDGNLYDEVWFEEWLIKTTFGEETTEDSISVVGGNQIVNVNAGTYKAIMFSLNTELEQGALGGVKYVAVAGVEYSFVVVEAVGSYSKDSNKYYSRLTLKIKNNTNLPQFTLAFDDNTYLFGTNYASECNGKKIGDNNICDIIVDSNVFSKTITLNVKKLQLNVSTSFNSFANSMTITYKTTFEEVLKMMGLKYNYYMEDIQNDSYYSILGMFVDDEQIDKNHTTFDYYLNNIIGASYVDGGQINLVVKYEKIAKASLLISAITSRNGADSNEMSYSVQLYYVAGTQIAGEYNNGFDGYILNSYKNRTMIASNNVNFANAENGVSLNGNVLTTSSTWYYENLYNVLGTSYQEKFDDWYFAYLTTASENVGTIITDSDKSILTNGCYLVVLNNSRQTVNGVDDMLVRNKYNAPKNMVYSLTANSTLYAVFVPTINITLKSQNFTDIASVDYVLENQIEFGVSTLSDLVMAYQNKLYANNNAISNLEVDYVLIDGVRYDLKNGSISTQIIYTSTSKNIEIYVVWKEKEIE